MTKKETEEIKVLMDKLGITEEEAKEVFTFDNEAPTPETPNEAPKEKKKTGSPLNKVKNAKAKKKVDVVKQNLMDKLYEAMMYAAGVTNIQEMSTTKITFKVGEDFYSVSLTKHKTKPDGYADVYTDTKNEG